MSQRARRALLVVVGIAMTACENGSGPPEADGEARISVTTTGLDLDLDGYRVIVEGVDRGSISPNGTMQIRLDAGPRSFALTGIDANCTPDGSGARQATIAEGQVVQVDFTVICTATSGVIGIVVGASGTNLNGAYRVSLDGAHEFPVGLDEPAYVSAMPAGDHVVSLDAPLNCLVENNPQSVSITTGGLVRDTVEARFAVDCGTVTWNVQVTAPTTGVVPASTRYRVMHESFGYWGYGGVLTELGFLHPNETLNGHVDTGEPWANYWHIFLLEDVPSSCSVGDPHPYPDPGFTVPEGGVIEVEFEVTCPS
jgi:hypothetical protein